MAVDGREWLEEKVGEWQMLGEKDGYGRRRRCPCLTLLVACSRRTDERQVGKNEN
jgi:hypothetical protein